MFDTKATRKVCFNHGVKPNSRETSEIARNKSVGVNQDTYKNRFGVERSFAWVDKFRAFTMINLRHLFAEKA